MVTIEDEWGFPMIDGDFPRFKVLIEDGWGFPMIDGDFSWFDGIAIGAQGSFILFGACVDNGSLSSPFRPLIESGCI